MCLLLAVRADSPEGFETEQKASPSGDGGVGQRRKTPHWKSWVWRRNPPGSTHQPSLSHLCRTVSFPLFFVSLAFLSSPTPQNVRNGGHVPKITQVVNTRARIQNWTDPKASVLPTKYKRMLQTEKIVVKYCTTVTGIHCL